MGEADRVYAGHIIIETGGRWTESLRFSDSTQWKAVEKYGQNWITGSPDFKLDQNSKESIKLFEFP